MRIPLVRRLVGMARYSRRLGPLVGDLQRGDDHSWATYTTESYQLRLEAMSRRETRRLVTGSWQVRDGRLVVEGNPLNRTHKLLYETILGFRPASVCEFGFGAGDHLANLRLLLPNAVLSGFEVSEEQLAYAQARNGDALRSVALYVRDMADPQAAGGFEQTAEIVFCNAVLMHIHGGGRHVVLLRNMLAVSARYVLFSENWSRHNYVRAAHAMKLVPQLVAAEGAAAVLLDKHGPSQAFPPVRTNRELVRAMERLT